MPKLRPTREIVWETPTLAYVTKFVQLHLRMPNSPAKTLVSAQECPTNVICLHEANRSAMSTLLQCLCAQQPRNRTIVKDSRCNTNNLPFARIITSGSQPNLHPRVPDSSLRCKGVTPSPIQSPCHPRQLHNESKSISKTHLHQSLRSSALDF